MRKLRKWVTAAYGEQKEIQGLDALRQRETCILISGLMTTPDDRVLHIKRYVPVAIFTLFVNLLTPPSRYLAALIVESLYGRRVTSLDDPCMVLMDTAAEATTATGTTGGTLVDMLPLSEYQDTCYCTIAEFGSEIRSCVGARGWLQTNGAED